MRVKVQRGGPEEGSGASPAIKAMSEAELHGNLETVSLQKRVRTKARAM